MAKLADASDLKSEGVLKLHAGSIPAPGTSDHIASSGQQVGFSENQGKSPESPNLIAEASHPSKLADGPQVGVTVSIKHTRDADCEHPNTDRG